MTRPRRAPRCQRRPTEEDFARFPVGASVSVAWGSSGRRDGVVVGRTALRLRVFLDTDPHYPKVVRNADGSITKYDCQPSPLTVRPIPA